MKKIIIFVTLFVSFNSFTLSSDDVYSLDDFDSKYTIYYKASKDHPWQRFGSYDSFGSCETTREHLFSQYYTSKCVSL